MPCPIVWFEALGQHADKLEGFYGEVLGWSFETRRGPPRPPRARPLGRFRGAARPAAAPPWWVTFYTPVPDLDAAIAKARARQPGVGAAHAARRLRVRGRVGPGRASGGARELKGAARAPR
jgi:predicted enzyme related to lactoylglutathione lyase